MEEAPVLEGPPRPGGETGTYIANHIRSAGTRAGRPTGEGRRGEGGVGMGSLLRGERGPAQHRE